MTKGSGNLNGDQDLLLSADIQLQVSRRTYPDYAYNLLTLSHRNEHHRVGPNVEGLGSRRGMPCWNGVQ